MESINREEYKRIIGLVYMPILAKLRSKEEKEYQDFLKKIIETAERSFRSLVFRDFREVDFKKEVTKNNILFWLEKVSLALISYSYYSVVSVKEWHNLEDLYLSGVSYKDFFDVLLKYYNFVFNNNADWKDIVYYGSGYKEMIEKRRGKDSQSFEGLLEKDYHTIGSELLAGIWGEDIDSDDYSEKRGMFLGRWVKKTHEKLIIPFLEEITLTPNKKKT